MTDYLKQNEKLKAEIRYQKSLGIAIDKMKERDKRKHDLSHT